MKEGRRVIVPTPRQMEQMARKQAEGFEFKNSDGMTGLQLKVGDIDGLKEWIRQNTKLTEKEKKQILEYGMLDKGDKFLTLNVIRILEAIRDGMVKNEKDDKDFKYSMDKLVKKWANSEVEVAAAWDKNGMFLGWESQANDGKVQFTIAQGHAVGGTTLHSHPSSKDRFFGGTFSDGDWKNYFTSGEKTMVVTSREGTYIIDRNGPIKATRSDINRSYVRTTVMATLSMQKFSASKLTKFGCSQQDLAVWRDRHNGAKQLASLAGVSYTFIPNKGFEGLAG
jgi:hypothetical protein